jgi:hypothetical protein
MLEKLRRLITVGLFKKLKGIKKENQKQTTEATDAVLTLYSCRADFSVVSECIKNLFVEVTEKICFTDENEFVIVFKDKTSMQFNVLMDLEETKKQSNGMTNFFAQAPLDNEKLKTSILKQISIFNCIIGIQFQINEDEQRTNYIMNTIYSVAEQLNAFVLYPNMHLYDSKRKLLISIDGNSDFEEFYPIACSDILDKDVEESQQDIDRKKRSFSILQKQGIPYIDHLKAAALEGDSQLQDKETTIKRLCAIFMASVQGEVYLSEEYENKKEMMAKELKQMQEKYNVSDYFSQEEKEYILNPDQNLDLHYKFIWRYEGCAILLWALNIIELQAPSDICDVSELASIMWSNTLDSLIEKAQLRSKNEILDLYDLTLRYNWACVDWKVNTKEKLTQLDAGVVYERHYALNWLLKVDGIEDWDAVTTNT